MTKVRTIAGVTAALLAAAAMLVVPAAGPASGQDHGDDAAPTPRAELQLAIAPISTPSLGTAAVDRVSLTCDPDGGTHPTPVDACDSLRAVDGHFDRLPQTEDTFCPLVYDPVVAVATGRWEDREETYAEVFSNRCFAAVGTDDVFDL